MADRTLLILSFHFPPSAASGSHRLLGFARHLPRFGWRTIVVATPSLPWESVDPDLENQIPPGTVVERVPYFIGRLTTPIRMWVPFSSWILRALPTCTRVVRRYRPDAILTSGPPHQIHNLGWILKRWFGTPWLADFRDPWVACTSRRSDQRLGGRWEAMQERAVMRGADVIIANAPNACAALQDAYPDDAAKMVAITNGFDPERFMDPLRAINGVSPGDGPVTILHPGNIYGARDPRPLLHAIQDFCAERTTKARPVHVRFLGNLRGDPHADLSSAIQDAGLESVVSCSEQVPYSEALDAMLRSDILLLLDSPGRRIGVPAKLYEFIGAGRPVLAVAEPDGDTAWVLREAGILHRVGAPNDPADIKRALNELIHEIETGKDSRIPDIENSAFTRENMTRELAVLLGRCTSPPEPVSNAGFGDHVPVGVAWGGRLADR